MNSSLKFSSIILTVVIFVGLAGCKNNPPLIVHNHDADTIRIKHGEILNMEFSFISEKKELESVEVIFNEQKLYSGKEASFSYKLATKDIAAGEYTFVVTAIDKSTLTSKKNILLIIEMINPLLGEFNLLSVRATSALAEFELLHGGGGKIKEIGLLFSSGAEPGINDNKLLIKESEKPEKMIKRLVNGFPRDSDLYVRAFASNTSGVGMTKVVKIRTMNGIPSVKTGEVKNIHSKTVKARGLLITDGGSNLSSFGICYSTDPNPDINDRICKAERAGSFIVTLDGLTAFTKYYYRTYARNRFATSYGDVMEFETSGPPTVITGTSGRIMVSSINMSLEVTDNGGHEVTEAGICYSMMKNPSYDNNTFDFGKGVGSFSGMVPNLDPGSKFHFRAYAVNSEGVGYGEEIILFTKIGIPEVNTIAASEIDFSSVVISGEIPDDGGLDVIERGIAWDTISRPNKSNNYIIVPANKQTFSCRIDNLRSGQKYYARAYARNEKGIVYADAVQFVPYLQTRLVDVKTGSFLMGSEDGDKTVQAVHQVNLDSYQISKYEVMNSEFCKFLNYHIDDISFGGDRDIVIIDESPVYYLSVYGEGYQKIGFDVPIMFSDGKFSVRKGFDEFAAILVSWNGARMFCEWAGGRLPTEAEWEFAARGGENSSYIYAGGNDIESMGWYRKNSEDAECPLMSDGRGLNSPGQKEPNSLGIYDMSGNVSEWCYDIYNPDYYSQSSLENPMGPEKGISRVIRGGSWADTKTNCTVYIRIKSFDLNKGYDNIGFRLVRPFTDK